MEKDNQMEGVCEIMAKILILDDEEGLLELCTDILEGAGHEVITAEDGEKGLTALVSHDPKIVLVDSNMPLMDGYEFAKTVREDFEYLLHRDVVMIATSSMPNEPYIEFMTDKEHLQKPFGMKALLDCVEKYARKQ